jgi:predicted small secreted protein
MFRALTIALLILALTCIAGCETFKGFGRDMQKAGDWIEDTAAK